MTDKDCIEILEKIRDDYNLQAAIPGENGIWNTTCANALTAAMEKIQGKEQIARNVWLVESTTTGEPIERLENVFYTRRGGKIKVTIEEQCKTYEKAAYKRPRLGIAEWFTKKA